MTIENSTSKHVVLTAEQYAQILYTTHFIKELCDLVDESSLVILANSITLMLSQAVLNLENCLHVSSD